MLSSQEQKQLSAQIFLEFQKQEFTWLSEHFWLSEHLSRPKHLQLSVVQITKTLSQPKAILTLRLRFIDSFKLTEYSSQAVRLKAFTFKVTI